MNTTARFTQLHEWLTWMENLHPSEIDLGLERIANVAQRLGIEKSNSKVITVGGTNGKGSCVATLEKFLINNGKSVGTYTSPHLLRYNERIKLNGHQIHDDVLCNYFAQIDAAREDISLTYFEFGTLAAFLAFANSKLDYWLLEVGLGGRLDAVNVIDPDIAVITSIDFDHEQWLGETRDAIAFEKFGILRKQGKFVCAEQFLPDSAKTIIKELDCNTLYFDQDFKVVENDNTMTFAIKKDDGTALSFSVAKKDVHLPENSVAAALQVLELLRELPAVEQCQSWLSELHLMGRFQQLEYNNVKIVLDVAHNPAAMKKLAQNLRRENLSRVYAVVAMMADKKLALALHELKDLVGHWHCAQIPSLPRSAKAEQLADILVESGTLNADLQQFSDVESALKSAINKSQLHGTAVLVFGSFYTVADAHNYFSQHRL